MIYEKTSTKTLTACALAILLTLPAASTSAQETPNCSTPGGEQGQCLSNAAVLQCEVDARKADRVDEALDRADKAQQNADEATGALKLLSVQVDDKQERLDALQRQNALFQAALWATTIVALGGITYLGVDATIGVSW